MGHEEDLVHKFGISRPTITNYYSCRNAASHACGELFSDQERLEKAGNGRLEWRTGPIREVASYYVRLEGGGHTAVGEGKLNLHIFILCCLSSDY